MQGLGWHGGHQAHRQVHSTLTCQESFQPPLDAACRSLPLPGHLLCHAVCHPLTPASITVQNNECPCKSLLHSFSWRILASKSDALHCVYALPLCIVGTFTLSPVHSKLAHRQQCRHSVLWTTAQCGHADNSKSSLGGILPCLPAEPTSATDLVVHCFGVHAAGNDAQSR